ncbi:hypothetical protein C1H46_016640 [Malus baccata]|uniref:Mitochondrial glycoprotein n=1 Tax=Malus baccata TaxID=106549 RepID=A0A540MGB9_MALBA|nr:hypothetical protein C1H46_016640 [Malus baccata]
MARLIRTARTALPFFSRCASKTLVNAVERHPNPPLRNAISASLFHSRHYASEAFSQSPMEANILRIIRNEVEYQSEYAPPQQSSECTLHLSMLVDITKGDDSKDLEFLCSAWPDRLEVQKVYVLERDRMPAKPYMGPDFRSLNGRIQQRFSEYLEARGVNDELSVFLHQYMMNKDRIELIKWLGKVKSFVEK